ncbi:hypothetical protein, variant 1 [Verruconis gallopava]|uniref:DNA-directed RNA polymerase III subunit RPC9 n=2 Tax=Verruconis gallopava TaxID=253628 RepID=A0A0D2A7A2_9PEZI|nr:hypothetical protein, variant 1 [Verruconis gallopava]KIW02618.1 hypothetical protein, variant 1 [Verruconis gallopava]
MKIKDPGTQQIPNGLVLHHVTELEAKYIAQKRMNTIPDNLKAAIRDVKTNLSRPPTVHPADQVAAGTIPKKRVVRLVQRLTGREFKLLPSEALMVVNHRPILREELSGLLEELEDRMSEEKQDRLLELVSKELGRVRADDGDGANGADDEDDEGEGEDEAG